MSNWNNHKDILLYLSTYSMNITMSQFLMKFLMFNTMNYFAQLPNK